MLNNSIFHIASVDSVVDGIQSDCGYIIISSDEKYSDLGDSPNVLVLHFADTEEMTRNDAFTLNDVERIYGFLDANPFPDFFVTCDAGASRSSAVVAGLLRLLERDDDYIWKSDDYRPNILVYKTMLEAPAAFIPDVASEIEKIESMSAEEYRQCRKEIKRKYRNSNDKMREVYELLCRIRKAGDNTIARKIVTQLLINEKVPLDCIKTSENETYTYAEFDKSFNDFSAVISVHYDSDSNHWLIRAIIKCIFSRLDSPETLLLTAMTIPYNVSIDLIDFEGGRAFIVKAEGGAFMQNYEYIYEYIEGKYRDVESAAKFVITQIKSHSTNTIETV